MAALSYVSFYGKTEWDSTHHSCVDMYPASPFKFPSCLLQKVGIGITTQFDVDQYLVAGLVVWYQGHALDVVGVHPIHVDVDFVRK